MQSQDVYKGDREEDPWNGNEYDQGNQVYMELDLFKGLSRGVRGGRVGPPPHG